MILLHQVSLERVPFVVEAFNATSVGVLKSNSDVLVRGCMQDKLLSWQSWSRSKALQQSDADLLAL